VRKQVLVVDDDRPLRTCVCELLLDAGFSAIGVADGVEALDYLAEKDPPPPHAILLDLMMPRMDGWEFRERQMADPRLRAIPTLIMSAAGPGAHTGVLEARRFLSKPMHLDELIDAVKEAVETDEPPSANAKA
jgi:two-component system response regulator MprA